MRTLVFLLEELSTKEMLSGFLPRIVPGDVELRFIVFEGKQDLEKQIVRKLRSWMAPNSKFVVIRDQDAAKCEDVKQHLLKRCEESGKTGVLVRIACRELESYYLGDLAAVEAGLEISGISKKQRTAKFRQPDSILNPSTELSRLTNSKYQKVSGSRAIGPHLDSGKNCSHSFNALCNGISTLIHDWK